MIVQRQRQLEIEDQGSRQATLPELMKNANCEFSKKKLKQFACIIFTCKKNLAVST
jgi:hypothetical protein